MVVTDSTARLPPWRPRITERMSCLPVTASAMRMATSFASEPVTAKFTTSSPSGRVEAMRSAKRTRWGFEYHEFSCQSLPASARMTSTSSGWQWPSTLHIMPAVRS